MKRIIAGLLAAVMLCGASALAVEPDGFIASGGQINDLREYTGVWQDAYQEILGNHFKAILAYQGRTQEYQLNGQNVKVPCSPVSLTDISGDGIPELIFMEAPNDSRGDLYIYTSDGRSTKCALYISGITRLGYDDIGNGFDLYLSSANGGTLVAEYDEYEWPWVLQFTRNALGRYTLLNYLRAEYDNSDMNNDRYYINGSLTVSDEYEKTLKAMRNGRTMTLSAYTENDLSHYGLSLRWEDAVSALKESAPTAVPTVAPTSRPTAKPTSKPTSTPKRKGKNYGLTIDKLATRKGPGTQYEGGGTYSVKGQYIKVLAKAWDKRNGIWWVKCEIPYHGEIRILWTGWKRFDHSTISLDDLPTEHW